MSRPDGAARKSVSQGVDAYGRLKHEIMENRLKPGVHVAEPELAQRFGVSRTPVREALIRLSGEGLVDLVPRRGARVLPVSPDDMREIYELLTALEPEAAAAVAARRPPPEALAPLEEATSEMERCLKENDRIRWAAADDQFHRALLSLNGNRRLEAIVGTLFDQAHRARSLTLWMRESPVHSTVEHRAILRTIAAGDAEGTRTLFRAHRQRAAAELNELLERSRMTSL